MVLPHGGVVIVTRKTTVSAVGQGIQKKLRGVKNLYLGKSSSNHLYQNLSTQRVTTMETDDLVPRLKTMSMADGSDKIYSVMSDAADEILRLREANNALAIMLIQKAVSDD